MDFSDHKLSLSWILDTANFFFHYCLSLDYPVRHRQDGSVYVENLSWHDVDKLPDVDQIMSRANSNRAQACTDLNEHSSRSHMILCVDVHGINIPSDRESFGQLFLVDLAGSERVRKNSSDNHSGGVENG